jgi:hypothetical protein
MSSCVPFSAYGFTIDWCTWTWSWTFQDPSSIPCHILICIFYALSVKGLQKWVASKKHYTTPTWLEPVRKVHNYALSLVSFIMFAVMTGVIVMDGRLNSWSGMACQMTENTGVYGFINFIYLVSKLWEWVDTYILVLTKKTVITLHWFHHMTTFTMAAVTHNFPVGGFALINCLVHTVMYLHYANPVRWARPFITSGQLIQFVIVISIHVYGFFNPDTCFNMQPILYEWWFCFIVVFGFFAMFCIFFVEEYLQKKNKKVTSSESSRKKDI